MPENAQIKSHELMRLLIPGGEVPTFALALGVSPSLVYQMRLPAEGERGDSGCANPIQRLDVICELAPTTAVGILVDRFGNALSSRTCAQETAATESDIKRSIAQAAKESGEALAALMSSLSPSERAREVAEAREAFNRALQLLESRGDVHAVDIKFPSQVK